MISSIILFLKRIGVYNQKSDVVSIKTVVIPERVLQEVASLERPNCRAGRGLVGPTKGLNDFYNSQLFLDRAREMNTYVVWGWHLPTFAWGVGGIAFNRGDSPRFGEELSAYTFNGWRTVTVCTPL